MFLKGKMPPTRRGRWCCEMYKENGGKGNFCTVGVRAPESRRRKGLWQQVSARPQDGARTLAPILYWTDEDVWNFIRSENIPYCSLYDEGFKRLGCVGCPMSSRRRQEFERWPTYERMWKEAIRKAWEKWRHIPNSRTGEPRMWAKWKTFDEVWRWWMEEVDDSDQPDCQMWLW